MSKSDAVQEKKALYLLVVDTDSYYLAMTTDQARSLRKAIAEHIVPGWVELEKLRPQSGKAARIVEAIKRADDGTGPCHDMCDAIRKVLA